MKKLIVMAFFAVLAISTMAQSTVGTFDLCGIIRPEDDLTYEQVVALLGKPVKYTHDVSEEDYYEADIYEYDGLELCFVKGIGVASFYVSSPEYPVATSMVTREGLRVGQKAGVLKKYPFTNFIRREDLEIGEYKGCHYYTFHFKNVESDDFMSVVIKDGIIKELGYHFPTV